MIQREKIYIIPTQYGLMYGAGILVSLLGGTLYNNNLAFILCFFLLALFLIGMVQTHNNIRKLSIEQIRIFLSPSESTGHGVLWIKSHNEDGHQQILIEFDSQGDQLRSTVEQIFPKSLGPHYFEYKTALWGKKNLKKIKIATRYPFGFFYAWRNIKIDMDYWIYPKPHGAMELEEIKPYEGDPGNRLFGKGEDFSEHRLYQLGDSQKHIDWKAFARGRPLLTKQFEAGDSQCYLIDMAQISGTLDQRAHQASKWIHLCEQENSRYLFKTNQFESQCGGGEAHRETCLQALAELKKDWSS